MAFGPSLHAENLNQKYGAAAGGLWREDGIAKVFVSISLGHRSSSEAVAAALAKCRSGGGQNCRLIHTAFRDCGYIVAGSDSGGAGWATGGSAAEATAVCQKRGFTSCDTPIGGCND